MRDLQRIATECMEDLEEIGIRIGVVMYFKVDWGTNRRCGQCKTLNYDTFGISISHRMLNEDIDIKELKSTIYHELLHTCHNCQNHGDEWKRQAAKVNKALGYNIQRLASKELSAKIRELYPTDYKYVFKCENCDNQIKRMKASKFVKYTDYYVCGICGGKFKRIK